MQQPGFYPGLFIFFNVVRGNREQRSGDETESARRRRRRALARAWSEDRRGAQKLAGKTRRVFFPPVQRRPNPSRNSFRAFFYGSRL